MNFTTTKDLVLVAVPPGVAIPAAATRLDMLSEQNREAAARAICESLSGEARERAVGDDMVSHAAQLEGQVSELLRACDDADSVPAALAYIEELDSNSSDYAALCHEIGLPENLTIDDAVMAWEEKQRTINDAIRAAGYDPDEVGAAEVISCLHEDYRESDNLRQSHWEKYERASGNLEMARAQLRDVRDSDDGDRSVSDFATHVDGLLDDAGVSLCVPGNDREVRTILGRLRALIEDRDKLRAQLREWRETVGPLLEHRRQGGSNDKLAYMVSQRATKLDDLLSATSDDSGDSASKRWQRLYQQTQARLDESTAEHDRLRKRVDYLEQKLSVSESADAEHVTQLQEAQAQKAALRKRVEELEAELSAKSLVSEQWSRACAVAREHCPAGVGESYLFEGIPALAARATRAETAVEAMRRTVERYSGPPKVRGAFDATDVVNGVRTALYVYDANKPEPTDEQPRDRVIISGNWPDSDRRCWVRDAMQIDRAPDPGGEWVSATIEQPRDRDDGETYEIPAAPTDDTPEAIARDAVRISTPLDTTASRIRALVVGELRTVRDRIGQLLPPWHHRTELAHGKSDAIEHINERIRELEKGGAKEDDPDDVDAIVSDAFQYGWDSAKIGTPYEKQQDEIEARIRQLIDAEGEQRSLHGRRRELVEAIEAVKLLPVHRAAKLLEKRLRELESGGEK